MFSLRQQAEHIGVTGNFSVVHDFFGHITNPGGLSLKTHIERLQCAYIDINVIQVGSDQFTADDDLEIDIALRRTRDIYAQSPLAIRRIYRWYISTDEANGFEHIKSPDDAKQLTYDWTSPPDDAIDVFFVLTFADFYVGWAPIPGPCDKNDSEVMSGCVVAIEADPEVTGCILAHELGHYLGLEQIWDEAYSNNLMCFRSDGNNTYLDSVQRVAMRDHCFVK